MTKKIKNTFLITSFLFLPITALANTESDYLPKEKKRHSISNFSKR